MLKTENQEINIENGTGSALNSFQAIIVPAVQAHNCFCVIKFTYCGASMVPATMYPKLLIKNNRNIVIF